MSQFSFEFDARLMGGRFIEHIKVRSTASNGAATSTTRASNISSQFKKFSKMQNLMQLNSVELSGEHSCTMIQSEQQQQADGN